MASTITPIQIRYNTPYDQQLFDFNTVDSKVYSSRETNKILNLIGSDVVIKGMTMSDPVIIGASTVRVTIGTGVVIQDQTLLKFSDISTVDIDCADLDDTTSGCHLGVFLNYQYVNTIVVNQAKVEIYHIQADGVITDPFGTYNADACRILLGAINFTKSGTNVTEVSKYDSPTLPVSGSAVYMRGENPANIKLSSLSNPFSGTVSKEDYDYFIIRDYLFSE